MWQMKEIKVPFSGYYTVLESIGYSVLRFCGLDEPNSAMIRTHVLAGERPRLGDDIGCPEGLTDLVVRCWDPLPDVRMTFRGMQDAV